jgi:hypothetical protein
MVERPSIFFRKELNFFDKILAVRSEGLFGQGIKWDAPSSFGLWAWRVGGCTLWPSKSKGRGEFTAKSLDFGLDLWKLHTMPGRRLRFLYLIGYYFQPISLDSQQKFGHSIPRP